MDQRKVRAPALYLVTSLLWLQNAVFSACSNTPTLCQNADPNSVLAV